MLWVTRPVAMGKEAPGWIGLSRLEVYSAQCWKATLYLWRLKARSQLDGLGSQNACCQLQEKTTELLIELTVPFWPGAVYGDRRFRPKAVSQSSPRKEASKSNA
ncbi:hypothetical protein GCM10027288_36920 [Bordetella tumbae]